MHSLNPVSARAVSVWSENVSLAFLRTFFASRFTLFLLKSVTHAWIAITCVSQLRPISGCALARAVFHGNVANRVADTLSGIRISWIDATTYADDSTISSSPMRPELTRIILCVSACGIYRRHSFFLEVALHSLR